MEEEPLQVGMLVTDESPVIAKQVHASGLLHMDNLRLVHILRDGALITQPQLQTAYLRVYDTLYVAGAHVRTPRAHTSCAHLLCRREEWLQVVLRPATLSPCATCATGDLSSRVREHTSGYRLGGRARKSCVLKL